MTASEKPHVIVIGNEKGGCGKSTTTMHIAAALMAADKQVGAIDLDLRQRTFTRYLENRLAYQDRNEIKLPMPRYARVRPSTADLREAAAREERDNVWSAVERLSVCDFIVIDCPGNDVPVSRAAHSIADSVVTPINDSFIDFDMLAQVNPEAMEIAGPSLYSEMVWDARKQRAIKDGGSIDWLVMRNRMSVLNARNKHRVGTLLGKLADRVGFRVAPGLTERVIYREMFLNGLTLLDMNSGSAGKSANMSHIAARQEVRALIAALELPGLVVMASAAQ